MLLPRIKSNCRNSRSHLAGRPAARAGRGSVLPVVVFSLGIAAAYLALAMDVMRTVEATRQIQFAADSAALYGYSYAVDSQRNYAPANAQVSIAQRVKSTGGDASAWNSANSGPGDGNRQGQSPVSFADFDIKLATSANPLDSTDLFLQVRARRDGSDAIRLFFFPAIFAANAFLGMPVPPDLNQAAPYRITEVVGQPASRIGAGARLDAPAGSRQADLIGFACLPLAISNLEFAQAAGPATTQSVYPVDLVSRATGYQSTPARFAACFVNLAPTGSTSDYYGAYQGNLAIDNLTQTLRYFAAGSAQQVVPPGIVERGAMLGGLDPADPAFVNRKAEILNAFNQLPLNRNYVVPVVRADPLVGTRNNEVVGFAWLKLVGKLNADGSDFQVSFQIGPPAETPLSVRNAAVDNGLRSLVLTGGVATRMPAPVPPFLARRWSPDLTVLDARPRGVVLAPSPSPRTITQM